MAYTVEISGTSDKLKTIIESEQLKTKDIIETITEHLRKSNQINQVIVNLDSSEDFNNQVSHFRSLKNKKVSLEIQQTTNLDERNCTFGTDKNGNGFVYYRENNIVIHKNELCTVVQTLGFAGYIQMKKTMEHFEQITETI